MKLKLRLKRHAASVVVHQAAWSMEHGCSILFSFLEEDTGVRGAFRGNPVRGALTEQERKLITQRKEKVNEMVKDLRKIAWHLEKGARDES